MPNFAINTRGSRAFLPDTNKLCSKNNKLGNIMAKEIQSTLQEIVGKLKMKEIASVSGVIISPFIIIFSLNKYMGFSDSIFEIILSSTISGMFLLLLVFIVVREVMSGRKEKYANITEQMHYCSHISRDIASYLNEIDPSALNDKSKKHVFSASTNSIIKILDRISTTYSMLTGTRCRASIKTIYKKNHKLYVRTLARDTMSYESNSKTDKKRYNSNDDSIEENEDFGMLYDDSTPGESYFICNNLIKRRNYTTSSFKVYGKPDKELNWYETITCKRWPLPYRSAIVWPIQQKENRFLHFDGIGCIGFLAVDSESRGVFNKKWDPWLGAGIADSLFHPINKLFAIVE